MPYSDIGNYPFEVFLDYAVNGVNLWKENPRIADMPEDIFLNYVLFHRVRRGNSTLHELSFTVNLQREPGGWTLRLQHWR